MRLLDSSDPRTPLPIGALFDARIAGVPLYLGYDVSADDQRFVVVQNWYTEFDAEK